MKKIGSTVLTLLLSAASALSAQQPAVALHDWHDAARDVYVNGELDRGAQVLICDSPRRIALLSQKLEEAAVLDLTANTANSAGKDGLRLAADRNSAKSDAALTLRSIGKIAVIDQTTYLFSVEGKTILLRQHSGLTGEIAEQKLYETTPVWQSLKEAYKPNDAAVTSLKSVDQPAEVTLVFGSWCPDSRTYVPRLMKALEAAGNAKLKLKLIGIDNAFRQPTTTVQSRGIINVPTVIVERGGREIGRIIETPAASTIEEDLAAILSGKPNVHKGRWEHGPQIAQGTYLYRDPAGKECGTETWELYGTSEGGSLVHSEVKTGDLTTNVFHRVNGKGQTSFVEITRQRGNSLTRVRYNIDDHTLTARLRGNVSGVVQQTLETPARFAFSSPSVAGEGRAWPDTTRLISTMPTYIAPTAPDATIGLLGSATYEVRAEQTMRVRAGEFQVKHVIRKMGTEVSECWLHKEIGVPVRGKLAGGMEYELLSLESGSTNK